MYIEGEGLDIVDNFKFVFEVLKQHYFLKIWF